MHIFLKLYWLMSCIETKQLAGLWSHCPVPAPLAADMRGNSGSPLRPSEGGDTHRDHSCRECQFSCEGFLPRVPTLTVNSSAMGSVSGAILPVEVSFKTN